MVQTLPGDGVYVEVGVIVVVLWRAGLPAGRECGTLCAHGTVRQETDPPQYGMVTKARWRAGLPTGRECGVRCVYETAVRQETDPPK